MDVENLIQQIEALSWKDINLILEINTTNGNTKLALIGRIVATHPINRISLHSNFKAAWSFVKNIHIEDLYVNLFLFTFQLECDKQIVWNQAPWNIKGHLLILKPWPASSTWQEISLNTSIFHIQVHSLTRDHMNEKMVRK